MNGRKSECLDGIAMRLCGVAFMGLETVSGIEAVIVIHDAVAGHLGYNAGTGNGQALGIPLDHAFMGKRDIAAVGITVNDHFYGIGRAWHLGGQRMDGARHGLMGGTEDIDCVDHRLTDDPHAHKSAGMDLGKSRVTLTRMQGLRIADAAGEARVLQPYGRRHHWPGERATPGFIDPKKKGKANGFPLIKHNKF